MKHKVNLFWTGGWDSTFQLLQLLLFYKCQVTPFYLIDEQRNSLGVEIKTMKQIKDKLFKDFSFTKKLLHPIKFYSVSDILPDQEISSAFQSILKKRHLGEQYEWLSRFCKQHKIYNMQLSIQKHNLPNKASLSSEPIFSIINDGLRDVYAIDSKFKKIDEYTLFQYFHLPLIKTSKLQMATISSDQGWNKIMQLTWFCHNPTCEIIPCGICKPCLIAIKEDFGWRIPYKRRVISFYFRYFHWPLKDIIKNIIYKKSLYKFII